MSDKSKGICPFCGEQVTPIVVEENILRRDQCQCPECSGIVYVCRTPGCNNYAKGGDIWDDEFCPSCTNDVSGTVKSVAVVTAIGALIGALQKKD